MERNLIIKEIQYNPFRVLGVFSNSSMKDVVANEGKMKAFLKVGKTVSYPLDLAAFLPAVDREGDAVTKAKSQIALSDDKVRHAQFWFVKSTPIDDIAFSHLYKGDFDGAVETFRKKRTASSLQNLVVCYLIQGNYHEAIQNAVTLYSDFLDAFVNTVDQQATVNKKTLVEQFVSGLYSSGVDLAVFKASLADSVWTDAICGITSMPLVDKLKSALEMARASRGKGCNARLSAGKKLMVAVKIDLPKLKGLLDALQYQILADELANEILQCGIDYFNDSEDDDAPHIAMPIQKYALTIAEGSVAKERCKENVDILKKIIESLPPKEVAAETRAIRKELEKFCALPDQISHSLALLNATKSHVQSIKKKLGSTNSFYLKISTQVVGNALHNVIEEVNGAMKVFNQFTGSVQQVAFVSLKATLQSAWNATKIMDTFDLEPSFESKYNTNRSTLKSLCDQVGITSSAFSSSSYSSSSGSSSSDDTNWGCIIAIIVLIIIFIASMVK